MGFQTSLFRRGRIAGLALAVLAPSFLLADGAPARKPRAPHPSLAPVEDVAGLPRVLLIGDSISMGYTVAVREKLRGKANVHRPPVNCAHTKTGLEQLDAWLATGGEGKKWDVIHFNWGLHDLKFLGADGKTLSDPAAPGSRQQIPPDEYRENLAALAARLQKTGAKLVWRNTTPVPAGSTGRRTEDVPAYNGIAAEVMAKAGIPTHDLYSYSMERLASIQIPQNVHFTPEGSAVLAEDVARAILEALKP